MSSDISYFKIVPKPFSETSKQKESSTSSDGSSKQASTTSSDGTSSSSKQGTSTQDLLKQGLNQKINQGLIQGQEGPGQKQGQGLEGTSSPQSQVQTPEQIQLTEEHKKILQKEDEIMAKISGQSKDLVDPETNEEPKTDSLFGKALAFYMVIVKAYFGLIFKLGDSGAKMLIEAVFPGELAEQIFSENPDIKKIVPAFTKVIQVLENPVFRAKLNEFVTRIKQTLEPQVSKVLDSVIQILLDVGTKNISKLFSSLAITISAFPPAAVVIDIANLMSAGIHTAASALDVAGVSLDSLASMKKTILSSADDFTEMVDTTLKSLDTLTEPSKMLAEQGTSLVTPSAVTPSAVTPSTVTPSAVTPSTVTPSAVTPSAVTPSAVTPSTVTPSTVTPSAVTPNKEEPVTTTVKETPKKEEAQKKEEPVKPAAKKGGGTIKNLKNQTSRILKSIFDFNQTNKIKKTRRKNHKKYTKKYK